MHARRAQIPSCSVASRPVDASDEQPGSILKVRVADDSVAKSGGLSDIFVLRSAQFLGESDEKPFRPADTAEPIRAFILDYFTYELRAAPVEPFKRLVDVVHGEHDAEVA